MNPIMWKPEPEAMQSALVWAFKDRFAAKLGTDLADWDALWQASVDHPAAFWQAVWEDGGVIFETPYREVLRHPERMPGAIWFEGARLNFARNLLRRDDATPAIIAAGEDGRRTELSWQDLQARVAALEAELAEAGVGVGDRVAGIVANIPEAVIAMLATASLGATWSSCSPDFGVQGILDRFGQIEPKVLIAVDGYHYAGKRLDIRAKLAEVAQALAGLERVIVHRYLDAAADLAAIPKAKPWDEIPLDAAARPRFTAVPFDQPLYVLYSSGTTGKPKAIVHGTGGVLLQHLKEHRLHGDLKPGERLFYFTTCGWMMWNWLVSGLACEATLVLFDGSPFHPGPERLFELAAQQGINVFGTSAKYIDAVKKSGYRPKAHVDLKDLRAILSTGSPLLPESFDFVYDAIKDDLLLGSISGGTDIVSCFVLNSPLLPVRRGEIQCRGLGMAVDVWDDTGRPLRGQKGELVCTKPFPVMPVGFWNDPTGQRYHNAYFSRFSGVWWHGDYAELTEGGGLIIHGRSDAVLNPGGVRIGTAEIYRQVEQIDEVLEALCVGQNWEGDVRVVLFVRLRPGQELDEALIDRIKRRIRDNTTPRHVPARIVQVSDVPRTLSGKIVELAVRDVIHGRDVKNTEALANPEALDQFRNLPELGG
ncbi:MAG: acetoacetate--CoA ligase [Geminicoccaceae bacterium]|nr:MAG: acetoacetate--CoA ligase [Geminicoccaceae bacterium]